MRIWSLHPRYLDRQGLTACWRETLLAQAVLAGRTRGYRAHPQLERFRAHPDPLGAVCWYLHGVADEADARGYRYDRARVDRPPTPVATIEVARGQLDLEWAWLRSKLARGVRTSLQDGRARLCRTSTRPSRPSTGRWLRGSALLPVGI